MNSYGWCLSNLHSVIGALLFCVSVLLLVSVDCSSNVHPCIKWPNWLKVVGVVEPREKWEGGR
jgi:hypothetical protein